MNSLEKTTIIAIPFTGGNAYSYRLIEQQLSEKNSWVTLELPGRGSRISESLIEDLDNMVNDLFAQITKLVTENKKYILYGHSLGGILGYELIKKLTLNNIFLPESLVVSGRGAPNTITKIRRSELSYDEFWKNVYNLGGLQKEIIRNKELLELYYPILKADFKVEENYNCLVPIKKISPPISIIIGEDDMDQKKNGEWSLTDIKKWKDFSMSGCKINFLPGNHFFIFDHPKKIVDFIMDSTRLELLI